VAWEKRLTKTLRRTLIRTTKSTKSPNLHTAMQQFAITIKRHLQAIRHSVHATKQQQQQHSAQIYITVQIHQSPTGTLIGRTKSTKLLNRHTVMQQLAITVKRHLQAIHHSKHVTITAASTTERTDLCHTCRCI